MKKTLLLALALTSALFTNAQYQVLHNFSGPDGANPYGSLISDGTYLYGTTNQAGAGGYGSIFKIKPDGSGYQDIYNFVNATGGNPEGTLLYDGTYLYGTTSGGGGSYFGVIFRIKPDGTGYTELYDCSYSTPYGPRGALITDGTYLYGMMNACGTSSCSGSVFKIKKDGTGYTDLVTLNNTTGKSPLGSLITDGTYLYGMTNLGGANNDGTIFKVKTDGTGFTVLHDCDGSGYHPRGSLISDGTYLYGLMNSGGTNAYGVLFKIKTDGTGYTNIVNFTTDAYGNSPFADLYSDGTYFYGTTFQGGNNALNGGYGFGVVFKVKPDGTSYDTLFTFNGAVNGSNPRCTVYSDGTYLYGVTPQGGTSNKGTIFKTCMSAPCAVGIEQHNEKANAFKIYPNPANNTLNIERVVFDKNDALEITDVLGNSIKRTSLVTEISVIDVSELNSGVYFVKIGNSTQKFIKN
ncbi:MAG: choice-of-anchor tandem repeat GloVer-containing protein [Bacteroidia bacterium]